MKKILFILIVLLSSNAPLKAQGTTFYGGPVVEITQIRQGVFYKQVPVEYHYLGNDTSVFLIVGPITETTLSNPGGFYDSILVHKATSSCSNDKSNTNESHYKVIKCGPLFYTETSNGWIKDCRNSTDVVCLRIWVDQNGQGQHTWD